MQLCSFPFYFPHLPPWLCNFRLFQTKSDSTSNIKHPMVYRALSAITKRSLRFILLWTHWTMSASGGTHKKSTSCCWFFIISVFVLLPLTYMPTCCSASHSPHSTAGWSAGFRLQAYLELDRNQCSYRQRSVLSSTRVWEKLRESQDYTACKWTMNHLIKWLELPWLPK